MAWFKPAQVLQFYWIKCSPSFVVMSRALWEAQHKPVSHQAIWRTCPAACLWSRWHTERPDRRRSGGGNSPGRRPRCLSSHASTFAILLAREKKNASVSVERQKHSQLKWGIKQPGGVKYDLMQQESGVGPCTSILVKHCGRIDNLCCTNTTSKTGGHFYPVIIFADVKAPHVEE